MVEDERNARFARGFEASERRGIEGNAPCR